MAINKVVYGSETLIDLTEDTATADTVVDGYTLHLASGVRTTGTAKYAGSAVANGSAIRTAGIPYGECDSTSTSTAFTATIDGITSLYDGACVMLKNGVVTSASGFTININGLGAKPVYSNMATGNDVTPTNPTRETTIFNINYTLLLIYSEDLVDGGAWINYRGYDANTNTLGYQLRTNSTVLKTYDKSRYYRMFFTSADGTHWVPANTGTDNSATSAKTVNQRPIDPFGRIIYYSANTNMAAESNVAAANCWDQYTLALGYSFNMTGAALTLTTQRPVYLKCAPQSNGSAIIDSTTPYVQTLPSTKDGKIYIFLGIAYSATNIELVPVHPVYWHDGTGIRLWTGAEGGGSTVSVTQTLTSGTKIGTVSIDGTGTDLYAPTPPTASTTTPSMDGTASYGSGTAYARANHVHPTDTSRQATLVSGTNIKTVGGTSLLGSGNVAVPSITTITVTIATNDWNNNTCTKNVSGVTASNAVIVTYAPSSKDAYTGADIYCSAQSSGTLTFNCTTVPSEAVTVNVMIIDGASNMVFSMSGTDSSRVRVTNVDFVPTVGKTYKVSLSATGTDGASIYPQGDNLMITAEVYDGTSVQLDTVSNGGSWYAVFNPTSRMATIYGTEWFDTATVNMTIYD